MRRFANVNRMVVLAAAVSGLFSCVEAAAPSGGQEQRASELDAPTASITSTAFFDNPVGPGVPSFVSLCGGSGQPACAAAPPAQVRWGQPVPATSPQSGLGYTPAPDGTIPVGVPFALGTLTHF